MSEASEAATHLCLDCEQSHRESFVTLRTDGTCYACGSKAVMDLAMLAGALGKRPRGSEERSRTATRASEATSIEHVVREASPWRSAAKLRESKTIASDLRLPLRHSTANCDGELRLMMDYYGEALDRLTIECTKCNCVVGRLDDVVIADDLRVLYELESKTVQKENS